MSKPTDSSGRRSGRLSGPGRATHAQAGSTTEGRAARTKHLQAGYTLAEALTVVLLIGLLSAAVVPGLPHVIRVWRAEAAARQILADLRLARAAATATQEPHRFVLAADRTYSIINVNDGVPLPGKSCVTLPPVAAVTTAHPGSAITFDAFGRAEAGTITVEGAPPGDGAAPARVDLTVFSAGLIRLSRMPS